MALQNKLILRASNSPFTGQFIGQINDVNKNSVLSWFELDNDLLYLKGQSIYTATTDGSIVTLHKLNGDLLSFPSGSGGTGSSGSTITGGTVVITATTENGGSIAFSGDNSGFFVDLTPMAGSGLTIDNSSGQYMLDLGTILATPHITSDWEWYSGTTLVGSSGAKNISVPTGANVLLITSSFMYSLGVNEVQPQTVYGDWILDPGPDTQSLSFSNISITTNTTYTVNFSKPSSGLVVVGNHIEFAQGLDHTSDTSYVRFVSEVYHGHVTGTTQTTSPSPSEGEILSGQHILRGGNFELLGVTSPPDDMVNHIFWHHFIAYPVSDGLMATIVLDGSTSTSILGVYGLQAVIPITNSMGFTEPYYIYTSNDSNPYDDNDIRFIH